MKSSIKSILTFANKHLFPILAGFVSGFIVMMFFEFINSLRYPFPSGMDPNNIEHVKAFLSTLPSEAYTFIVLGWIFGSFLGGYVVSMLTKEKTYTYSFLIGTLYFSIGAIYNFFIGNTLSFALMTLPVFFIFTYLGHRTAQGK